MHRWTFFKIQVDENSFLLNFLIAEIHSTCPRIPKSRCCSCVDKRFMEFQLADECASGWRQSIGSFIMPVEFFMTDVGTYDAEYPVDVVNGLDFLNLPSLVEVGRIIESTSCSARRYWSNHLLPD